MAHRTLSRLLLTAFGVSLLAAAGQLGVAFGFGILRLTGAFTGTTVNQWPAQLVWAGWFAANAAVVGAVLTERLAERHGGLTGTHRQLAVACSAALGAVVVAPLCMRPARAVELVSVDPVWAVAICAVLGAVVGAGAALAALLRPAFAWNMAGIAGAVWLLALLSVAPSLAATGPLTPVRLGVLEPSWLSADAAQRLTLLLLPLIGLLAGAATGALARWRGQPPLISGPSGVAGPILVAFAYLAAGPGDASDRYQLAPYYGALITVAVGALGSAAAALLPLAVLDRDTADSAGTAIEPTAILQPLPASPTLPTSAARPADRPAGTGAAAGAVVVADPPGGTHTSPGLPTTSPGLSATGDVSPPHWHWPGEPAPPVPATPDGPPTGTSPRPGVPIAAGPTIDGDLASAADGTSSAAVADSTTGTPSTSGTPSGSGRPDESDADTGSTAAGPLSVGAARGDVSDAAPDSAIGADHETPETDHDATTADRDATTTSDHGAVTDAGPGATRPTAVDLDTLGTPALAVQATDPLPNGPERPDQPMTGAINGPSSGGPDPVGDGGDLTPTAGRAPGRTRTPRPLAEPPNRAVPATRSGDQARSSSPFDDPSPSAYTPPPWAGPNQSGGTDSADTVPVPPGADPASAHDDGVPTDGGLPDTAVTPAARPAEGPETAPWPRHRLPLPDLNTTESWNAFAPARRPDPADETAPPTGSGTDGPSDDAADRVDSTTGPDPAAAARDVSAAFASAAPAVSTDPAAAARDLTAAFTKPPVPRAEPAAPEHEREKGRRGLFRRSRPRPAETEPAEQEEPLAAQDEEYVDWVAGLGRPSIEDEPLPKETRRRLRPTGRHHRE
ncbi:hypothetical protein [Verrucosispora sp. NA02020]|uniref:hypothetical protein n=1 Tax=Verrucosispora sp. NA02020 TaxID=2742132 RepID=UPI00159195B7|nr:hypothetical protein [Verrucosispora sp. NA02020]QKW16255.1 hypothetical protein HUT12_28225 [Verrucosispora sp. NA02020]